MAADPSLLAALRETLAAERDPELSAWLRMTVDQEDGDYASYLGGELYERHAGRTGERRGDDAIDDEVVIALIADLVSLEARALGSAPGNDRQRARTRAALQALAGLAELAPDRAPGHELLTAAELAGPLAGRLDDGALAERASAVAAAVADTTTAGTRRLVDLTLLPVTRMHDELMFIRMIQVFEILYTHVGNGLADAAELLDRGEVEAACAVLAKATGRMQATRMLYRVLTTMPPEAFSVIRNNTDGRSAIQSLAHRRVEQLSTSTVQEAFERRSPRLDDAQLHDLVTVLKAMDTSWTTAKRTHWGITLKIIGSVAGTGGTTGADYLATRSVIPLFPFLHGSA
ncbi:hypothetical protein GCM10009738_82260 [Kitasatospora viridis]